MSRTILLLIALAAGACVSPPAAGYRPRLTPEEVEWADALRQGTPARRKETLRLAPDFSNAPEFIPGVIAAFSDPDPVARLLAENALAAIVKKEPARSESFLVWGLEDANAVARRHAAQHLGEVASADAVAPLVKILDDPIEENRVVAAIGLHRITDRRREACVTALLAEIPAARSHRTVETLNRLLVGAVGRSRCEIPLPERGKPFHAVFDDILDSPSGPFDRLADREISLEYFRTRSADFWSRFVRRNLHPRLLPDSMRNDH
ncbi:MAG: HEAT repeat domain-containing protein [Planctomycetota bacterium]